MALFVSHQRSQKQNIMTKLEISDELKLVPNQIQV